MLKGHVFNLQTFTSECFALFIDTFLNKKNGVVQGCALSNTTNSATIGAGFFVIKGRFLEIISNETVNVIEDGFYKLICEIDLTKINTTTELNQASIKIIKGTTNYPELVTTDTLYQYEFSRFKLENNIITNFTDKRTFVDIQSIFDSIQDETGELITQIQSNLNSVLDESLYFLKTGGTINGNLEITNNLSCNNIINSDRKKIYESK